MRKWSGERPKRRRKGAAGPAKDPANAPEPLQPKYFEADIAGQPAPAVVAHEAEPAEEPETESGPEPQLAADPAAPAPAEQGLRPARRRRRRGGRGRSRGGAPQTPVTPVEAVPPADGDAIATEPVAAELLPPAPARATPTERPIKGVVTLAIGLPGSGKTTWFKRHEIRPLSSDMMRTLLFDDVHEQRFQDLVFSNLRSMLKARLIARRPSNYVDATNLTPQERQHWIKLAKDFGYEVHAVFFDVPLDVCIERHQRRDRVVPEDIMRKMAAKLKAPVFEEGFAKITVVRVKKKE
jgi:predicted kinase